MIPCQATYINLQNELLKRENHTSELVLSTIYSIDKSYLTENSQN
jgi:hypothetical protein